MRILFLCTGNSARSQMAEGFARKLFPPGVEIWSAGVEPRGLHLLAVRVMAEKGIDISRQHSKGVEGIPQPVDVVVTLCGDAAKRCPYFPGAERQLHWELPDPAQPQKDESQQIELFRAVRDRIESHIQALAEELAAVR